MEENLVVSLDAIKGIRLQCKECGSEAVVGEYLVSFLGALQQLIESPAPFKAIRLEGMDKNLVVSLDEIKGIRLQCKECGSEAVVNPADPYPYTLLGVLQQLSESPAPFKAVRLEIDGGQVESE